METSSPRLKGAHEIRVRLGGISRQRVYQITSRAGFPAPAADLVHGKVWLVDDVEAWITESGRNSSTPKVTAGGDDSNATSDSSTI